VVTAVTIGEDYKKNAKKEAELILEEARLKAGLIGGKQHEE
jgi:hypothetical protein